MNPYDARGLGQLRDVGLGPGGDGATVFDPDFAHVEVTAVFRLHLEHLRKCLGPRDVEILFCQLGIGQPGALLIEKQVSEHDVAGLLQRRGEGSVLIAGDFEVSNFLQERRRSARSKLSLEFL